MSPAHSCACFVSSRISNSPEGSCAMTPLGMPLSLIKAVKARVSIPDRPMILRDASQSPNSVSERQFDAGVTAALKIPPTAAISARGLLASSSSTVVPVLPTCGKVKQMICAA